ncbi:MAG TPA: hypothetical protein VK518_20700 [Puia sp.]|nr:hypothetical protein [Puia sp.]
MKWIFYLAYKIISKTPGTLPDSRKTAPVAIQMIEDLLYRIQSQADIVAVEAAIAGLPIECSLTLDLYFTGELTRREIDRKIAGNPDSWRSGMPRVLSHALDEISGH